MCRPLRRQASSHRSCVRRRFLRRIKVLWERACPRTAVCQTQTMLNVSASSQASQLPQILRSPPIFASDKSPVGAGLPANCGVSNADDVECVGLFAGKPAPTDPAFAADFCVG